MTKDQNKIIDIETRIGIEPFAKFRMGSILEIRLSTRESYVGYVHHGVGDLGVALSNYNPFSSNSELHKEWDIIRTFWYKDMENAVISVLSPSEYSYSVRRFE